MKREYQKANKHREAGVDEDEEEEEVPTADKSVKRMQKMIRSREGNNAYESEDEENPYASDVSTPPYGFISNSWGSRLRRKRKRSQ